MELASLGLSGMPTKNPPHRKVRWAGSRWRNNYLGRYGLFGRGIASQVGVGLSELDQLGLVIDVRGNSETAFPGLNVGVDIGGGFNLLQIASDRRGTAASGHVWNVERHHDIL